jgi:hypothetical protein
MKYKQALKISSATIGISSNNPGLLLQLPQKIEVKSLLTDFHAVEKIPFSENLDGYIEVEDSETPPKYMQKNCTFKIKGPLSTLHQRSSDLRYSLWGNQGLLYRFTLYLLEKKHQIYNLHACALYNPDNDYLYVIIGGAGSGKTVYLLSGLEKGLKLFSTETVHFQIKNNISTWFIGSLVDNIRYGTLIYDFPQFFPKVKPPSRDKVWQEKIALDLSSYKTSFSKVTDPNEIYLIFPRLEEGRKRLITNTVENENKAIKLLFDNISQKLSETFILYDSIPVMGFEEEKTAYIRLKNLQHLIKIPNLSQISIRLSNPKNCWEDLLQGEEK